MKRQFPHTPAAQSRTSSDSSRRRPRLALATFAVVGLLTISGCGFAVDTPLHVTDVARGVTPGHDIVGKVGYPDGKITVTLAPEASPIHDPGLQNHRTLGETPCHYGRVSHKFKCPTTHLKQGLYLVQVTDAGQPGEGTAQAQVAITDFAGYNPHLVIGAGTDKAKAGPVALKLSGWQPGVEVRIKVIDGNALKTVFAQSAVPDASGAVTLTTTPLKEGYYNIHASDGLWKFNGIEGSYNDPYSGLEVR